MVPITPDGGERVPAQRRRWLLVAVAISMVASTSCSDGRREQQHTGVGDAVTADSCGDAPEGHGRWSEFCRARRNATADASSGADVALFVAAAQGDARSQSQLGQELERAGRQHDPAGCDRWSYSNPECRSPQTACREAAYWYRLAAEQGDAEAQARLGSLLLSGCGMSRDPIQAFAWLSLGAAGYSRSDDAGVTDTRDRVAATRDLIFASLTDAGRNTALDGLRRVQARTPVVSQTILLESRDGTCRCGPEIDPRLQSCTRTLSRARPSVSVLVVGDTSGIEVLPPVMDDFFHDCTAVGGRLTRATYESSCRPATRFQTKRSLGWSHEFQIELRPGDLPEKAWFPVLTNEGGSCTVAVETESTLCPRGGDMPPDPFEDGRNQAEIRTIQKLLGVYEDGFLGPDTRTAIGRWEAALGLPVRCRVSLELLDLLQNDDPRLAKSAPR